MKQALAAVITLAILGFLAYRGLVGAGPAAGGAPAGPSLVTAPGAGEPDPSDGAGARVQALLESARAGDVDAYLAAYSGPLRARLEREVREQGPEAFGQALRTAAAARKSHARFAPLADGPDTVRIVVESVYADRNERQTFRLERDGGDAPWLVTDVETVKTQLPASKYGAMATFEGPDGPPIQRDPREAPPPARTDR